jgi:succinate dehydrogenase/fumarate reductase-like Fe-S protein
MMDPRDMPTAADYANAAASQAQRLAQANDELLSKLKVCMTCGAVYTVETEELHFNWHWTRKI